MARTLVLRIEMGTPTVGQWCDTCNLPAHVAIPIHNLADDGVNRIGEMKRCLNCKPIEQR